MDTILGLFGQLLERIWAHHFATQWLWMQEKNHQKANLDEIFGEKDERFYDIISKN